MVTVGSYQGNAVVMVMVGTCQGNGDVVVTWDCNGVKLSVK